MMPIFVLCLGAILSVAAFAISLGFDVRTVHKLQNDADSAALAGASAYLMESFSVRESERLSTARLAAETNATKSAWDDSQIVSVEVSAGNGYRQTAKVKATLSASPTNRLASFLGGESDATRTRHAVAEVTRGLPLCVLTLSKLATGIEVDGGGTINAHECVVWSNSKGLTSMSFSGSGSASADLFCAAGNVYKSNNFQVTPHPSEFCDTLEDPLADWTPPQAGFCENKSPSRVRGKAGETVTLEPGTYCNGLTISADHVVLNPGTYFFRDGPLTLNGDSSITGSDVTLVLIGPDATIDMRAQSRLAISAPRTGPLEGLVITSDRSVDMGSLVNLVGGSGLEVRGLIYLPRQHLRVGGSGALETTAPNLQIIALKMSYSGTGSLTLTYDKDEAALGRRVKTASEVRLVE